MADNNNTPNSRFIHKCTISSGSIVRVFLELLEGVFEMGRSHPKQTWPFLWRTTSMNIFHIFKHSFQLKRPCASATMRRCYSIPLKWMKQWHATMQLTGIKTTGKMTDYRGNWVVYAECARLCCCILPVCGRKCACMHFNIRSDPYSPIVPQGHIMAINSEV